MDHLIDGIIIVFVLSCIVFFYNALKIQHGSKNFPTPKDDSEKKENKKWTIIDKSKTSKAVLLEALNNGKSDSYFRNSCFSCVFWYWYSRGDLAIDC